jgi:hypothetical protein
MSEQIDQFCNSLNTRLNAIEKRLLDAKAALEDAPQQAYAKSLMLAAAFAVKRPRWPRSKRSPPEKPPTRSAPR